MYGRSQNYSWGVKKLKDDVLLDDIKITYYPHFNYKLPWR